ncbi:MAG TPA: glycosyltransferase family 2 protein [Candidatus Binatia bacterium]|nr:glycosyltransferase family 2 protein [Candidatus Binatia bacterium]
MGVCACIFMNLLAQILLWIAAIVSMYFAVFWFLVILDTPQKIQRKHWKEWPLLSVIIPAYQEEDCIRETMESVLNADYPRLQLIVVNDGSTDRTEERARAIAARYPSRDITILSQKNAGKGAALNAGLKLARGEFFATMDSDSYVHADAPKKLLSYFTAEDIAAVVPAMKVRTPKNFLQKLQWYEYNVNMFYKELMGRLDALHVIPGPFPIYRTEVIRKLKGFATDGNLTEDLEMTLRLQRNQHRIVQAMDAIVETIAPATFKEFYAQRNRWFKGSLLNAMEYRGMTFNRAFGDFGMIQMPTLLISGALALILIVTGVYYGVKPIITLGYHLAYVNFDILTLLRNLHWNLTIFDLDFMSIALTVSMLTMSLFVFFLAHRITREPVLKHGWFTASVFLLLYYLALGVVWAGVAVDLLRGKRQRW